MITTSPTFKYWTLVLQLEMILLVFVASLRDGNFTLYLQTLEELAPWFFALDQQNYGRWLSVHIHDMKKLQGGSSMCYEDLMQGRFRSAKDISPLLKNGTRSST
ncbi:hypothetical protein Bpfe_000038 [Biomphalaria pfeifferi]|uniref:Uncharacterized protein n=1 Tax=Biomphalaria pfeifferi TaxID=112525 RepID=A0AAD8FMU8_BIOPF|nr:hypothetical protein Bpfe_000038 [Biomphalaria pfeifferi]